MFFRFKLWYRLYIFLYHHGNDVLSPWQPKIFMKEQERKMVIFVSFFCTQVAAHKINDIYFDNNTLRWYSSSHKKFRAKILNRFWEKLDRVQPTFWNLNFSLVDFGVFQPQNSHYDGPNIIQISPDNFFCQIWTIVLMKEAQIIVKMSI